MDNLSTEEHACAERRIMPTVFLLQNQQHPNFHPNYSCSLDCPGHPVIELLDDDAEVIDFGAADPDVAVTVAPAAVPVVAPVAEPVVLPPNACVILYSVGIFGPGLANASVPGPLVSIDSPNPYPSDVSVPPLSLWRGSSTESMR
jgi:hypothetical protein